MSVCVCHNPPNILRCSIRSLPLSSLLFHFQPPVSSVVRVVPVLSTLYPCLRPCQYVFVTTLPIYFSVVSDHFHYPAYCFISNLLSPLLYVYCVLYLHIPCVCPYLHLICTTFMMSVRSAQLRPRRASYSYFSKARVQWN